MPYKNRKNMTTESEKDYTPVGTTEILYPHKPAKDTRPKKNMMKKEPQAERFNLVNSGYGSLPARPKKDPLDGTSESFSPPTVETTLDYNKLSGSEK